MEQLKNITEFVVVSNLENRALNAGINKAQEWWKHRHDHDRPPMATPPPQQISTVTSDAIHLPPGRMLITILRGQDFHESRLSMLSASSSSSERPYVILECNQQRFQTTQADSSSTNRNPQWTSANGPFGFDVFNPDTDRLTIWVQQDGSRLVKRTQPKMLGMAEVNVKQLSREQQIWVPLRKDNRPAGQILIQVMFDSDNKSPPPPYYDTQ